MPRTTARTRRRRVLHTSPDERTCGRCKQPIPAGTEHHRDVSGTAHHPACVRLGVRPPVSEPRREPTVVLLVQQDRMCACCGQPIGSERSVTVQGVPWHHVCRLAVR